MLLLALSLWTTAAFALPDLPEDPAAARAAVVQEVLPELEARAETARRKIAAREAYFRGEVPLAQAFPELADASLDRAAVLAGRLVRLDDRAVARSAARVAPLPDLDGAEHTLRASTAAALDAEDAADALERRLLLGLRAWLLAHPELSAQGLAPTREALRAELEEVTAALTSAPDEARADLARRAAALDEDLRRLAVLQADLLRTATVPDAPPPDPGPDLARLDAQALYRLELAAPFLSEADRARVAEARRRWIETVRIPALQAELAAAHGQGLAVPEGELSALRAAFEAQTEPTARAAAALAWQVAQARAAAHARASRSAGRSGSGVQADRARERAEAAKAAAEAARRDARGSTEVRTAELGSAAARAQQRAAERWERTRDLEERLAAAQAERGERLAELTLREADVDRSGALGLGENEEADLLYGELRSFVTALRTHAVDTGRLVGGEAAERRQMLDVLDAEREEIATARAAARELAEAPREAWDLALDTWEAALAEERRAQDEALALARAERDQTLGVLHDAKALHRDLSSEVSRRVLEADRGELLRDLGHELSLMVPNLVGMARDRLRAIAALPRTVVGDFNWVAQVLRGSVWTLLLAGLWSLGRGRVDRAAAWLLLRLRQWDPRLRPADLAQLRAPAERCLRDTTDLLAGALLVDPVTALVPELGFALRIFLYVVVFRFGLSVFDLLFTTEHRPALVTVGAATWSLARRSLRWGLLWYLSRRLALYLSVDLLGAYVLGSIVRVGFLLAGLALLIRLLHDWEPTLRARMARLHQGTWLVRALSTEPAHWLLHFLHSLAIGLYFAAAGIYELVNRLAREREGVGRMLNVVSRYRLGQGDAGTVRPLPPEVARAIAEDPVGPGAVLPRPEVDGPLLSAVKAWHDERRQGLAVLVGDRGDGKRTAIDQLLQGVQGNGFGAPPVRVRLKERLTTEREMLDWLAEALGIQPSPATSEAMVEAIALRPPGIVVVEDVQLAFLRVVGGFDALRCLLYVLNASARRHFWLLTVHRPAWRYLSRLSALVNVEVFRSVVEIPPMGERLLRDLTLRRLRSLGYRLDFRALVRTNPFGADPEVEHERTVGVFFRLLAEASAGHPAVALRLLCRCLCLGEEEGVLAVRMSEALAAGAVAGLSDDDLFTLVALRTQDVLGEDELVQVTNLSASTVKSTVKHLLQRGLVYQDGPAVGICEPELPAITRTLRRRHFLQWSA